MPTSKSITERQDIASVSYLNSLKYPTPFLIFDKALIRKNYKQFRASLPKADIYFAVKCNSHPTVLKTLLELGSSFEVASFYELQKVINIGADPKKVIYSAPVKPSKHIKKAFEVGLYRFAFDGFMELDKIAKFAPGASVYLRIMVSDVSSKWPLSSKFGAIPDEASFLMEYALRLGLKPYGITFHTGSQNTSESAWEIALQVCGNVIKELKKKGIRLTMLNMGGGFPAKYNDPVPSIQDISRTIVRSIKEYVPYALDLAIEPGRALVANSAVMGSSVIGRNERRNKNWLFVDASAFHGLLETMPCQGGLAYAVKTSIDDTPFTEKIGYTITGPTCDSLDTIFSNLSLPNTMSEDDRVYIESTGAYTICFASVFNGFKPPKVYFIDSSLK